MGFKGIGYSPTEFASLIYFRGGELAFEEGAERGLAQVSNFRHFRQCSVYVDMDYHFRLCTGRHRQEVIEIGSKSVHHFTNYQRHFI